MEGYKIKLLCSTYCQMKIQRKKRENRQRKSGQQFGKQLIFLSILPYHVVTSAEHYLDKFI